MPPPEVNSLFVECPGVDLRCLNFFSLFQENIEVWKKATGSSIANAEAFLAFFLAFFLRCGTWSADLHGVLPSGSRSRVQAHAWTRSSYDLSILKQGFEVVLNIIPIVRRSFGLARCFGTNLIGTKYFDWLIDFILQLSSHVWLNQSISSFFHSQLLWLSAQPGSFCSRLIMNLLGSMVRRLVFPRATKVMCLLSDIFWDHSFEGKRGLGGGLA
jgi:hypothetical protein